MLYEILMHKIFLTLKIFFEYFVVCTTDYRLSDPSEVFYVTFREIVWVGRAIKIDYLHSYGIFLPKPPW